MASVSGATSSLGNTSLRGYGGFSSGIDRDAIIEQMTAGTTAKITKQKNQMTSTSWKQEAYQGISDKMLDLQDNYFSFASGTNLKYSSFFAKNQITTVGNEDVTKFVSATGSSDMVDYLSILGVKQLATSATRVSGKKDSGAITTKITSDSLTDSSYNKVSQLAGRQLRFGTYSSDGSFKTTSELDFGTRYSKTITNSDGTTETKTVDIDYTAKPEDLVTQLNEMLESQDFRIGGSGDAAVRIEFTYDDTTKQIGIKPYTLKADGNKDYNSSAAQNNPYVIRDTSTALGALGLKASDVADSSTKGISLDAFNNTTKKNFSDAYLSTQNMVQYLNGKTLSVTYGGQTKTIDILKSGDSVSDIDDLVELLQSRINKAFGSGKVIVDGNGGSGISFGVADGSNNMLTITSDDAALRGNIDIAKNASTNISMDSSIEANLDKLGLKTEQEKKDFLNKLADDGLTINGVTIEGVTKNTTMNQLIEKINNTKDVGVKASYMSSNNQFVLVATESGSGRTIELGGAAQEIFGNLELDKSAALNSENAKATLNRLGLKSENDQKAFLKALKQDGLVINGVKIDNIDENSTLDDIITEINAVGDDGTTPKYDVKASYDSDNQLVLTSRDSSTPVQLQGASEALFGTTYNKDGQDALIEVSYGNGISTTITSSTNTFNLEGLNVTVNSTFGYKEDASGNMTDKLDSSQAVTFSAKADVDGTTEKVKKFVEEYNELITEINNQLTTKPDKSYGPLTEEQKEEMSDTSVENWEKKAKQGLLYNDATIRELSMSVQSILTDLMSNGVEYKDLEAIGITVSDDYLDGGTITFDESKFKDAMTSDPDKVSDIFTGGGDVKKGLAQIIEDTFTPYATKYASRNGNSYGRLIEEAGSEKIPSSISNNQIYKQLEEMQKIIDNLNSQLKSEQDRYISKFTTMETLINQMNAQSSYLSQITG